MSLVRAVRLLTETMQGLPEAVRREILEILDQLEKPSSTSSETAAPSSTEPAVSSETPAATSEAPPATEESRPAEVSEPPSSEGSSDVGAPEPVNPQILPSE